jgi:hypothetical protein
MQKQRMLNALDVLDTTTAAEIPPEKVLANADIPWSYRPGALNRARALTALGIAGIAAPVSALVLVNRNKA